jgi:hypothetical protein
MSFVRLLKGRQAVYVNLDNVLLVVADTREDGQYIVQVTYVGGNVATYYAADAYALVNALNIQLDGEDA